MYLFATILYFLFVVYASLAIADPVNEWPPKEYAEKFNPVIQECTIKLSPDLGILKKSLQGDLEDNGDDNIKKFMLCIFDSFNLVDHASGEIHYYKILELLDTPEQKRVAFEKGKLCLSIHESKPYDTAFKFVKCLHKNDPEFYKFIIDTTMSVKPIGQ